jgi:hypothetical protein
MTVPVKNKPPFIVPPAAIRCAGFKSGQELEVKASGGVITIPPKLPSAADEYTPAQRRAIDAELSEAEKGPFYGPFDKVDEMVALLQAQLRKRRNARRSKPLR